jgi:hypothetical protein
MSGLPIPALATTVGPATIASISVSIITLFIWPVHQAIAAPFLTAPRGAAVASPIIPIITDLVRIQCAVAAPRGHAVQPARIRRIITVLSTLVADLTQLRVHDPIATHLSHAEPITAVSIREIPVVALLTLNVDNPIAAKLYGADVAASISRVLVRVVTLFFPVDDAVTTSSGEAALPAGVGPHIAVVDPLVADLARADLHHTIPAELGHTIWRAPIPRELVAVVTLLGPQVVHHPVAAELDRTDSVATIPRRHVPVVAPLPPIDHTVPAARHRTVWTTLVRHEPIADAVVACLRAIVVHHPVAAMLPRAGRATAVARVDIPVVALLIRRVDLTVAADPVGRRHTFWCRIPTTHRQQ